MSFNCGNLLDVKIVGEFNVFIDVACGASDVLAVEFLDSTIETYPAAEVFLSKQFYAALDSIQRMKTIGKFK